MGNLSFRALLLLGLFLPAFATKVFAFNAESEFKAKCSGCHTIGGGDLLGPDLKGVTKKRDKKWLISFIKDPMGMINRGDPLAVELFKKYRNMPMPALGLKEGEIDSILKYIDGEEGTPVAEGIAVKTTTVVAHSSRDAEDGKALFIGMAAFQNGGPQCLSCHQAGSAGGIAGGVLGPDLTKVFTKFGEAGLTGVLTSIAFPTMRAPYNGKALTAKEIRKVVAFLKVASEKESRLVAPTKFILFSILGLIVMLIFISIIWKNRRTETKRPLR